MTPTKIRYIVRVCALVATGAALSLWRELPTFQVGQLVTVVAIVLAAWAVVEALTVCHEEMLSRTVVLDRATAAEFAADAGDVPDVVNLEQHRR